MSDPVVYELNDNIDSLLNFQYELENYEPEGNRRIIESYPTVYIHNWKDKGTYDVYVGETNDIFRRTHEHFEKGKEENTWQHDATMNDAKLFVVGHKHFNKSLTLDVENQLIEYLMSAENVAHVRNGRGNPQNEYYLSNEFDSIFNKVWTKLRAKDKDLFPSISKIKDSAIFKASPLKKLTPDQEVAQELILTKVIQALKNNEKHKLIFIDGDAGTGKTVLNSSTFYELYKQAEDSDSELNQIVKGDFKCCMLVNHNEQLTVYEQIAEKLELNKKGTVVFKPTSFINSFSSDNMVDVAFVDEGHLLLTQGKQSYTGKNQLEDILQRAKVTVLMFDQNQVLKTEQYWENEIIEKYRYSAINEKNHIELHNQLRMHASKEIVEWLDDFTKKKILNKYPGNDRGYEIKVFDSPNDLDKAILAKANNKDTALSRLIATYDWKYEDGKPAQNTNSGHWEVSIGNWYKPWNYELSSQLTKQEKLNAKRLAWAEQPHTIGEVGSTYTVQGFDLNYAGVILGPSVKYIDGHIVFDPTASFNKKAIQNRSLSNGKKEKFGELLLQHEVRVLMTRGVNGLYIYACDDALRKALKEAFEEK